MFTIADRGLFLANDMQNDTGVPAPWGTGTNLLLFDDKIKMAR